MNGLVQDLRYAARTLAASPTFAIVAIAALALGIGATTAVFSIVDGVLLRPLPFPDPERLLMLWENDLDDPLEVNTVAPGNYYDWRELNTTFEGMAAFDEASVNLAGTEAPLRLDGFRVDADFFEVLGAGPLIGRGFEPAEEDFANRHVVILSHATWQLHFGADEAVIGRGVRLNDEPHTVIGVMPAGFEFPAAGAAFWVPLGLEPESREARRSHYLRVVGRVRSGVAIDQARAELDSIAARLRQEYPQANAGQGVLMRPLREEILGPGVGGQRLTGELEPTLWTALAAIGFVLLIACANVANLMLTRATARRSEIAVRLALGADRPRIVRQLLTESAVVALSGGALGLVVGSWSIRLFLVLVPDDVPFTGDIGFDVHVLAFALSLSLATVVVFGLAPALSASRPDLGAAMREGSSGAGRDARHRRFRGLLVTVEVALALMLLIGAGLVARSFTTLLAKDPGFRVEGLLTARLEQSGARYERPEVRLAFYDGVLEGMRELPGVESAAMVTFLPMTFQGGSTSVAIEGRPAPPRDERVYPLFRIVSTAYFETMGIRVRGRGFTELDRSGSAPVVVVNERFARHAWPGEEALGKRMRVEGGSVGWMTVVGVAGDVRQMEMEAEPQPEFYVPYRQAPTWSFFMPRDLVLRTAGEPLRLAASVRQRVWAVDPDMPVANVSTMEQVLASSVARRRVNMLLFGSFALAALVLAAVGIYGVVAFSVSQRTREIGLRMALGAAVGDVVRTTVLDGMKVTTGGLAIGLTAALALGRTLGSWLYEVSPTDPLTFVGVALGVVAVSLVASLVPARRAARVDPIVALRTE